MTNRPPSQWVPGAKAGLNKAGIRGVVPRLRWDKVALRLVRGVCGALEGDVPEGLCVVFAVTAPIREPSKTTAALVEIIKARFSLPEAVGEHAEVIQGNDIRVRVVTNRSRIPARIVGFVHNPDPPPNALLEMVQLLLNVDTVPELRDSDDMAPDVVALRRVCDRLFNLDH